LSILRNERLVREVEVKAAMLTADSRLATLERALALGFDEFLPKPILDEEEFLQRINNVMTRRR
jgi:CheY-like chemotaxis protein